jgi:hypothetical protein
MRVPDSMFRVRKQHFILIFFRPSSEDLSKFQCAKQGIKKVSPNLVDDQHDA